MHRAPAVNFSVKRSRWQARLIAGASLLPLAALVVFARGQTQWDVRMPLLAISTLATSSVAFVGWRHSPHGDLRWDGQRWHWSGLSANENCSLAIVLDLQRVVLVRVQGDAANRVYLWLERAEDHANWRSLRRALVSSQSAKGYGQKASLVSERDPA